MNICGVLIHCAPGAIEGIEQALAGLPGTEVHQRAPGGRLIVTVEDAADTTASETILAIHRLPGVISAALTYHSFEDLADEADNTEAPGHDAAGHACH
jgi:nitrate reductase NapD